MGGTRTTVRAGAWSQDVTLASGGTTTLTPTPMPTVCTLVNRRSDKAIHVPGASTSTGTALIRYSRTAARTSSGRWPTRAAATSGS
ncbi:hypothetical protein [Streptomyces fildesensis]|uniref:hypothetical protein n=1 Tax=Streptomyces fildesensis TaxID=375757 RepID=UPI001E4A254D|nr:hypothetical protein [Streptomyces fildesensis]